jgi:hypothetical protein
MSNERLDKHDAIHHQLFDENTAQVGSLGDLVEKHAGDAEFFAASEKSPNGVDGGEEDFEAEMLMADPADREDRDPTDSYSPNRETGDLSVDQTGAVAGIARGFGTHLPQDIGAGGFQVETLPDSALNSPRPFLAEGEELDDYDDDKADLGSGSNSQPFAHIVSDTEQTEPTPDRIPIKARRPATADEELDATQLIK